MPSEIKTYTSYQVDRAKLFNTVLDNIQSYDRALAKRGHDKPVGFYKASVEGKQIDIKIDEQFVQGARLVGQSLYEDLAFDATIIDFETRETTRTVNEDGKELAESIVRKHALPEERNIFDIDDLLRK